MLMRTGICIVLALCVTNSALASQVSRRVRDADDLYIDDEMDDEGERLGEGSGDDVIVEEPLKRNSNSPVVSSSRSNVADNSNREAPTDPQVQPLAPPPRTPARIEDDNLDFSGSGAGVGDDDEEDEDEVIDTDDDIEDIDMTSVILEEKEEKTEEKTPRKPDFHVPREHIEPISPETDEDTPDFDEDTEAASASPAPPVIVPPPQPPPIDDNDVQIMGPKGEDHTGSFFSQPGILAAIIGGAVVGLLCAILLVMFVVYRMRKKDEGSYALEEPKRSPAAHAYGKNSREFYA
uniref:Syndecan n=1 Tax=Lynceus sp. MCZ IZ 141354 TaxID=1930659 RepID=A0A9N6WRV8_9CRUS|nr:EOG090X0QLW [Lynceus sp. MCZ IZ 141354]